MGINVKAKGRLGEQQIASMLNEVIDKVRIEYKLPAIPLEDMPFQRNQNQSAVGGDDLTNPFGLSIEIKRQENLSINAWWSQTLKSSERFDNIPILIFKQNRKKWRVIMWADLNLECIHEDAPTRQLYLTTRAEIDIESFLKWFRGFYSNFLESNGIRKSR